MLTARSAFSCDCLPHGTSSPAPPPYQVPAGPCHPPGGLVSIGSWGLFWLPSVRCLLPSSQSHLLKQGHQRGSRRGERDNLWCPVV